MASTETRSVCVMCDEICEDTTCLLTHLVEFHKVENPDHVLQWLADVSLSDVTVDSKKDCHRGSHRKKARATRRKKASASDTVVSLQVNASSSAAEPSSERKMVRSKNPPVKRTKSKLSKSPLSVAEETSTRKSHAPSTSSVVVIPDDPESPVDRFAVDKDRDLHIAPGPHVREKGLMVTLQSHPRAATTTCLRHKRPIWSPDEHEYGYNFNAQQFRKDPVPVGYDPKKLYKCDGVIILCKEDAAESTKISKRSIPYQMGQLVRQCRRWSSLCTPVEVYKRAHGVFSKLTPSMATSIISSFYPEGWRDVAPERSSDLVVSSSVAIQYQIRPFMSRVKPSAASSVSSGSTPT